MSSRVDVLAEHFGFAAPDCYRRMESAGCFSPREPAHIQLTDLVWLEPDVLARWRPDERQLPGLVPFAETLDHNRWCWYPGIDPRLPAPVVYCPDDDEVAIVFAPDFAAFCYRAMLEECCESFLVEREGFLHAGALLADYAERLARFLPSTWGARLRELSTRILAESGSEGFFGVIGEDEYEAIIAADIAYDRLNEEFAHLVEPDQAS